MSTYLIVAYQTAGGRPLRDAIDGVTRQDPEADFKLLVPATRIQHLFTWTEGESNAVAAEKAEKVAERLRQSGVRLTDVMVENPDPLVAVSNELARGPDYAAILVSTFPVGISRWLGIDLPSRLEKDTGLPVIHVIVNPEDSSSTP